MLPKDDNNNSSPSIIIISTCLLIAVTLCSSAGTVFDQLTTVLDVPPFLAAFWRLFLQNIIQFIPFVHQLRQVWRDDERRKIMKYLDGGGLALKLEFEDNTKDDEDENISHDDDDDDAIGQSMNDNELLIIPKYIKSLPLLVLSGFALGVHFSMWVYSLRYTSLTHSLLWVCMSPIVLNISSWTAYISSRIFVLSCFTGMLFRKPSLLETIGAILGVIGAAIMLLDSANVGSQQNVNELDHNSSSSLQNIGQPHSHPPSLHGDIAAFMGAVAVCVYLTIGKHLRSWLPIWLYVFPVIGFASITCLIFALVDNDHDDRVMWTGMSHASVFAFFSKQYFFYALYLAIGPGIFGHTMINTLLRYISPLIVSTALLSEPVTGSVIGHMFGMQASPALYTWIDVLVLLLGLCLVVVGESEVDDKNMEEKKELTKKAQGGKYGSLQPTKN